MRRIAGVVASGLIALALSACAHGVHIETLPIADSALAATAAAAATDERELGGHELRRMSISVLPFDVQAADTSYDAIGFGFADLLLTDLAVSRRLAVVDRLRLDDVQRELALSTSHAVDRSTALRIGRTVAAQDLVVGSMRVPSDDQLDFDSDVADVSTGRVRVALGGDGSVDEILDAEHQLALRIFDQLGIKLSPDELAKLGEARHTPPKAFAAFSKGVQAEARGDAVLAQAAYERAIAIDPTFRPAVEHHAALVQRTKAASASSAAAASSLAPSTRQSAKPKARSDAAKTTTDSSVGIAVPSPKAAAANEPNTGTTKVVATAAASAAKKSSAALAAHGSVARARRDSIGRVRRDSVARVRRDSIARMRRDLAAARRAVRRDSIAKANKARKAAADSAKARRAAEAAARSKKLPVKALPKPEPKRPP